MRFRCVRAGIYPASVRNQIIILDMANDKFHLLSDKASQNMLAVYRGEKNTTIFCGGKNVFTHQYLDYDKYQLLNTRPVVGVSVNFWRLAAADIVFKPWGALLRMLMCLHQAHCRVKQGLPATLACLDQRWRRAESRAATRPQHMATMIGLLNAATLLYPKKTACLAWSVALAYAALPHGFPLTLNIGVQNRPFYSHAWLEMAGKALCDAPDLHQRMVTIFHHSWGPHV